MKKNDKYILLAVVGVILAFCAYHFGYSANMQKVEAINADCESLQIEVDKLEELEANKQMYLDDTASMKSVCDGIIECFPGGLLTEDEIMYYNNMELEKLNQVAVPTITMEVPVEYPYVGETTVGEYEIQDDGILMYDGATAIEIATTYSGLKNVIEHIYTEPGRKAIKSINLATSEEGYLTGAVAVDFYYLKGTPLLYTPTNIPPVPLGIDNIFGSLDGMSGDSIGFTHGTDNDDDNLEDVDADETEEDEE